MKTHITQMDVTTLVQIAVPQPAEIPTVVVMEEAIPLMQVLTTFT